MMSPQHRRNIPDITQDSIVTKVRSDWVEGLVVDEAGTPPRCTPHYHTLFHFNLDTRSPHSVKGAEDQAMNSAVATRARHADHRFLRYLQPTQWGSHRARLLTVSCTTGTSWIWSRGNGRVCVLTKLSLRLTRVSGQVMQRSIYLCSGRYKPQTVTISSAAGDYNPTSPASVIDAQILNSLVVETWFDKSGEGISPFVRLSVLNPGTDKPQVNPRILCQPLPHRRTHESVS